MVAWTGGKERVRRSEEEGRRKERRERDGKGNREKGKAGEKGS